MMKLNYVATLLMISINCLNCGYSFECYQCRSDVDDHCDYLNDDRYLLECGRSPKEVNAHVSVERQAQLPYCRKISQALYFMKGYVHMTIRECAYIHDYEESCYKHPWKDSKVMTCDCAMEGCNKVHSSLKRASFCTVLCTFLGAVFLRWRFL